ncbi:MAG: formate--phosphoribosylaminoimidazolecarboxamide ligase family protein [Hadesarchaea archaeon]|nr:formate--phosphoribosylaminoimidazolecarboxamide ligase family protein [Hadesarchaea archaeon]
MIERETIQEIVRGYEPEKIKVGVIASHSALDTCDGAVEEGFRTLAVCQKGREAPYVKYFKAVRDEGGNLLRGCVDEAMVLDKFSDVLREEVQEKLRSENVLFVPNRSFSSYCDVGKIEDEFVVPLVGNRSMLRMEERGEERDYYWLCEKAGLPTPEKYESPDEIDCLVMVKLHHAKMRLERGFFTAASPEEFREKSQRLIRAGVIREEDLQRARIERYIVGPVFNLDFFYSPIGKGEERLELLGIDWRFESSLDGHVRLPAPQQMTLPEHQREPIYTVCGHSTATLRESLLRKVFPLAEKFVEAAEKYFPPGVIGPFCLQTVCDANLNFYIFDIAPRIGGGTNIHMWDGHPYGNVLWRRRMSTGRRMAMEIRRAIEMDKLPEIVT